MDLDAASEGPSAARLVPLRDCPLFPNPDASILVREGERYAVRVYLVDEGSEHAFAVMLQPETASEDVLFRRWGAGTYRCRLVPLTATDTVKHEGPVPGASVTKSLGEWPAMPMDDDEEPDLSEEGIGSQLWPIDPTRQLSPAARFEYERRKVIFERRAKIAARSLERARSAPLGPQGAERPARGYSRSVMVDDGGGEGFAPAADPMQALMFRMMERLITAPPVQPAPAVVDPLEAERVRAEIEERRAKAEHQRKLEVIEAEARREAARNAGPAPKSEAEIRAEIELRTLRDQVAQQGRTKPAPTLAEQLAEYERTAKALGFQRKTESDGGPGIAEQLFGFALTPAGQELLGPLVRAITSGVTGGGGVPPFPLPPPAPSPLLPPGV